MRIPNIPCVFITYAKEKCILLAIKKYSSYYKEVFFLLFTTIPEP